MFTNIPFMIVFVIVMIYTVLIVLVPGARFSGFAIIHVNDADLSWFILGMGLLFGMGIYLFQKLLWEPLSIWLRKLYPDKKWL